MHVLGARAGLDQREVRLRDRDRPRVDVARRAIDAVVLPRDHRRGRDLLAAHDRELDDAARLLERQVALVVLIMPW